MVSMTTNKIILKDGMYLQKYSYLSSNSHKKTNLGIKLNLSHRIFSGLSGMQIISFCINEKEIREKTQQNGVHNSAVYCSSIQNWYQINGETKLFYSD